MTMCPACGESAPEDASWCEACGSDLAAAPAAGAIPDVAAKPCVACAAIEISTDGYCMECGRKQPGERDHFSVESGPLVGRSDVGRRHHENEDAVAIGAERNVLALVVCDGVSSTPGSAAASAAAADAAVAILIESAADDTAGLNAEERNASGTERMLAAAAAAQAEATAVASEATPSKDGPPSSTFVAVLAEAATGTTNGSTADRAIGLATELTVGWIGDSRAYWIGETDAALLTVDHEVNGSLTRWIGADAHDPTPEIAHVSADGPGTLVVCSDGLWRYAETPEAMSDLVRRLRTEHGNHDVALSVLAEAMVDFANASGGHDNISVALCSFPISTTEHTEGKEPSAQ